MPHKGITPENITFAQTPALISVMGLSPAIITENVYAINRQREEQAIQNKSGQADSPVAYLQEVHVITTQPGFEKLCEAYFSCEQPNPLQKMLARFRWPAIDFTPQHVTILRYPDGPEYAHSSLANSSLNDIHDIEQHEILADSIMQFVARFTSCVWTYPFTVRLPEDIQSLSRSKVEEHVLPYLNQHYRHCIPGFIDVQAAKNPSGSHKARIKNGMMQCELRAFKYHLHTSLAGGRKSMAYFIGNMMNLLGREGDELSHVLVSELAEKCPEFYYPDPDRDSMTAIIDRQKEITETFVPKDQPVILAPIPFLRLAGALQAKVDFSGWCYADLVAFFNQSRLTPQVNIHCVVDHHGQFTNQSPRHTLIVNNVPLKDKIGDALAALLLCVYTREGPQFISFGRNKNWHKIHLLYLQKLSWLVTGTEPELSEATDWVDWVKAHPFAANHFAYMKTALGQLPGEEENPLFTADSWDLDAIRQVCAGQRGRSHTGGILRCLLLHSVEERDSPFSSLFGDLKSILARQLHPDVISQLLPQSRYYEDGHVVQQVQLPVGNVDLILV